MATDIKPGSKVTVTVNQPVRRASARRTLERLFLTDDGVAGPIEARAKGHKHRPKRRGGRIYVKRATKVHPNLEKGATATLTPTPQHVRDLRSVEQYVDISVA